MGLGKTMEMISLSLSNRPDEDYAKMVGKIKDGLHYSRATFVHCPNHLARQWKEEIQKNTKATVAVITTINEYKSYSVTDLCTKFGTQCVLSSYSYFIRSLHLIRFIRPDRLIFRLCLCEFPVSHSEQKLQRLCRDGPLADLSH